MLKVYMYFIINIYSKKIETSIGYYKVIEKCFERVQFCIAAKAAAAE